MGIALRPYDQQSADNQPAAKRTFDLQAMTTAGSPGAKQPDPRICYILIFHGIQALVSRLTPSSISPPVSPPKPNSTVALSEASSTILSDNP